MSLSKRINEDNEDNFIKKNLVNSVRSESESFTSSVRYCASEKKTVKEAIFTSGPYQGSSYTQIEFCFRTLLFRSDIHPGCDVVLRLAHIEY